MSKHRFSDNGAGKAPVFQDQIEQRSRIANQRIGDHLDELNAAWLKIEKTLLAMQTPRFVYVKYNEEDMHPEHPGWHTEWECLGLQRHQGKWRLCHAYDNDYPEFRADWHPITECSAEARVQAADQVLRLREKVVTTAETFIPTVQEAIAKLNAVLDDTL